MNRDAYLAYLKSKAWRRRRDRRLRIDNHTCQTCGAKRCLEVHHRTYERIGKERMGDLITLCCACHSAVTDCIRARQIDQGWPVTIWSGSQRFLAKLYRLRFLQ